MLFYKIMKLNTLNVSLYKKAKRYGRGIGSGKVRLLDEELKVRKQDRVYLLRVSKEVKCLFIEPIPLPYLFAFL